MLALPALALQAYQLYSDAQQVLGNEQLSSEEKAARVGVQVFNLYLQTTGLPALVTRPLSAMTTSIFCGPIENPSLAPARDLAMGRDIQTIQQDEFKEWFLQRPTEWKLRYVCILSTHIGRLNLLRNPFRLPQNHPTTVNNRPNEAVFFTALRVDAETLNLFRENGTRNIRFGDNQLLDILDFVPVSDDERDSTSREIHLLFDRFLLDQNYDYYKDQNFVNWIWENSSAVERLKYFCPLSGRLLVEPSSHRGLFIESSAIREIDEIETLNGVYLYYFQWDHNRKQLLQCEHGQLWKKYLDTDIDFTTNIPGTSQKRRSMYGVPKKFYAQKFWDWLWINHPQDRSRYFCPLTKQLLLNPVRCPHIEQRVELSALHELRNEPWEEGKLLLDGGRKAWITLSTIEHRILLDEQQQLLNEFNLKWQQWQNTSFFLILFYSFLYSRPKFYFRIRQELADAGFIGWLKSQCTEEQRQRYFCAKTGGLIFSCYKWHGSSMRLDSRSRNRIFNEMYNSNNCSYESFLREFTYDDVETIQLQREYNVFWDRFILTKRKNDFR